MPDDGCRMLNVSGFRLRFIPGYPSEIFLSHLIYPFDKSGKFPYYFALHYTPGKVV